MEANSVDVLLYVNTGTVASPVLTLVAGQQGASLKKGTDTIDVTTKDSKGQKEQKNGIRNWELSCDGIHNETDAGYQKLDDALDKGEYVFCKVAYKSGMIKTGYAIITDLSEEHPYDGESTYSATFSGTGKLTEA